MNAPPMSVDPLDRGRYRVRATSKRVALPAARGAVAPADAYLTVVRRMRTGVDWLLATAFVRENEASNRCHRHEGGSRVIKTDIISANAVRIVAPKKLTAADFRQLRPQIDFLISQHGQIRLLIDASGFDGWENIAAFTAQVGFIRTHQRKIERMAVIAGHDWQRWVIGTVRMFLHPEARAYDKNHENDALRWIVGQA